MSQEPLVLAVDDEAGILRLIKLELSAQGFRVITAGDGEEALKLVEEQRPDVILLDLIMPRMSGGELMRRIREQANVPIIMVTGKDADQDIVRGLEQGADDYVVKPFNSEEVGARIHAVLRRAAGSVNPERVIRVEDVEIDLTKRMVSRSGEQVSLTRTEWLLLQCLAANAGRVMLNAELLSKVWGPEYRDDLQYLRVWISRLRRKLEPKPEEPVIIKTMQGIGYLLAAEPVVATAAP